MMGMPTTGKTYTIPDVDMFLLNEEGKIIEHRSVQSGEVMMRQLGIEPPKQ
jgi:predicted ester cyclase